MKFLFLFYTSLFTLSAMIGCGNSGSRRNFILTEIISDNEFYMLRDPDSAALKFSRMASNPYYFFRGTLKIFLKDHHLGNVPSSNFLTMDTTGLLGDPHLENIGTLKLKNKIALGFNDFDAAFFGPPILDLRRMATSLLLAAEMAECSYPEKHLITENFIKGYSDSVETNLQFSQTPAILDSLIEEALEEGLERKELKKYTRLNGSGRELVDGNVDESKSLHPLTPIEKPIIDSIIETVPLEGRVKSVKRIQGRGVSSLTLARFLILTEGKTESIEDDIIYDVKEIPESPVENIMTFYSNLKFADNGTRYLFFRNAFYPDRDYPVYSVSAGGLIFRIEHLTYYEQGIDFIEDDRVSSEWTCVDLEETGLISGYLLANIHKQTGQTLITELFAGKRKELHSEINEFSTFYAKRVMEDFNYFTSIFSKSDPLLGWKRN